MLSVFRPFFLDIRQVWAQFPTDMPKTKAAKTKAAKTKAAKAKAAINAAKPAWNKNISLMVNSVDISGNGQLVIGGNYFHDYSQTANPATAPAPLSTVGVYLWNAQGTLLWKDEFQSTEGIRSVALSRDGTWAAGGGWGSNRSGFIYAYDAATGNQRLTYNFHGMVLQVALSGDGSYLVAAADSIYFFKRTASNWSAPQIIAGSNVPNDDYVSVDISDDGRWIVAGTYQGFILLIQNNNGVLSAPVSWKQPTGHFHWVAMAADGSGFVAGASSGNALYFNTAAFFAGPTGPAWTASLAGCDRCSCVAISDDGSLISAVFNAGAAGKVFLFSNQSSTPSTPLWSKTTKHSSNSTSLDSTGQFVTVADGYQTPAGAFYLYDNAGHLKWSHDTTKMSWPMKISSNAAGIAAGSDDGNVYYFLPVQP